MHLDHFHIREYISLTESWIYLYWRRRKNMFPSSSFTSLSLSPYSLSVFTFLCLEGRVLSRLWLFLFFILTFFVFRGSCSHPWLFHQTTSLPRRVRKSCEFRCEKIVLFVYVNLVATNDNLLHCLHFATYSGTDLVNCPTRWSLLLIFGFLFWSSISNPR